MTIIEKLIHQSQKQSQEKNNRPPKFQVIEGKKAQEIVPSYSHGFESIYKLEEVDVNTIRPIQNEKVTEEIQNEDLHPCDSYSGQYLWDFEAARQRFLLEEPIWVLGLSSHIERCLIEAKMSRLKDVMELNLKDLLYIKGLGQGHLEEIQTRIQNHLNQPKRGLDFAAWLRCLCGSLDRKKLALYFEDFGLQGIFTGERVPQVSEQEKLEWKLRIERELQGQERETQFVLAMEEVVTKFLKPWMGDRFGFVTEDQILERFEMVAKETKWVYPILTFFGRCYCAGNVPWQDFLTKVDEDVWAMDPTFAGVYRTIIEVTHSYFYHADCVYTLDEIVSLLHREFALSWEGFTEGFVEKILRVSSTYRVRRDVDGELKVRLAFWKPRVRMTQASQASQASPSDVGS